MESLQLRDYEKLSPFEIKDFLIKAARKHSEATAHSFINAGRGNPNWIATVPRGGFFLLGQFALSESRRVMDLPPGVGGMPGARGIARRFQEWLAAQDSTAEREFLREAFEYAISTFGFDEDAFVFEMTDAIIGDNYPVPDRMLAYIEKVVHRYLLWAMGCDDDLGRFDLFAVEGGTAAMCYTFKSLKNNGLVVAGDTIALGVPIFTPYLEIPELDDYQLNVVQIQAPQENDFQFSPEELDKLLDPKIKAFFLVNPGNPTATAISESTYKHLKGIMEKRPDLILLTDDVYGTFVPGFVSLMAAFPENTIGVYSFSKYFGATGWRLGVIALHENNILDRRIAQLDPETRERLNRRYSSLVLEPEKLKLIDRMVADSRDVALNHTAGLSLPQQAMMALFSLYELIDQHKYYQKACIGIVRKRVAATVEGLGIEAAEIPQFDNYYGLIDIEYWLRKYVEPDAVAWIKDNVHQLDPVFRLAEDHGIVLLNGSGFAAPDWSVRVSFANLSDHVYDDIGRAVRSIATNYLQQYHESKG